jgi:hypothetical protein
MEKEGRGVFSEDPKDQLPRLVHIPFDKIHKTQITRYASIHRGAFKNIEGRKLRVSTIGRTFLDMLRRPDYCGGMRHVMEIYGSAAAQYRPSSSTNWNSTAMPSRRPGPVICWRCTPTSRMKGSMNGQRIASGAVRGN